LKRPYSLKIPASINFLLQMLSKMLKKISTNRGLVLNFALLLLNEVVI